MGGGSGVRSEYEGVRAGCEGVGTLDGSGPVLLWNTGPRVQELYRRLREEGLELGSGGKGLSTWLAFGYVLATDLAQVIAVHDCDIQIGRAHV